MSRSLHRWNTRARAALAALASLLALAAAWLLWPARPVEVARPDPPATDAATVERGRYLATLGNCQTCHTARGGTPYAGGRAIPTPFGLVYSSNLTPGAGGLQGWTAADFWRALHHGQSRDGRWLTPAFPYNNTTHITRADSDALFAYLMSLPPVDGAPPDHALRWPYGTQAALKVWRALYFRPAEAASTATAPVGVTAERGAYLVRGLGHCSACHATRGTLGGSNDMLGLAGGLIPVQNWYAPSLNDPAEAGVQDWTVDEVVRLFRDGRARDAAVHGPMAEVVLHNTQHWRDEDLRAMALHLQALPRQPAPAASAEPTLLRADGAAVYRQYCAQCHGEQGEGMRGADGGWAYPPLAGNRAVTLGNPANLVQMVLNGGFGVATRGHPQPFGMPPYVLELNDAQMAAVITHIRARWGNQAPPVSELDVRELRGSSLR